MTDPFLRLEDTVLSVEPGGRAQTTVTVKNLGTIVEGFKLAVHGEDVATWSAVDPPEIPLYPDEDGTAIVTFSPPASGTRNGTFPFAIRAVSVVDDEVCAVTEGDLNIGRVDGLQSKLTPVTSSGRWRGKHSIELTNWGNSPVTLHLTAQDPDERLAFLMGPETVDLPLGATGHAQLRVRTNKPFLRGSQVRLPFQVVAEPDPPEAAAGPPSPLPNPRRAVMDGAFTQRPILSRSVVIVGLLMVLALVAGVVWALTRDRETTSTELTTGPPRTPELTVLPADATSVQLLWKSQSSVQTYRIHQLTPDRKTSNVISVDGALETTAVQDLKPATEYCFQLEAMRDNQSSPLSDVQCARTQVAVASAPPSTASSDTASSDTGSSDTASAPPSPTSPSSDPAAGAGSGEGDAAGSPPELSVAPPPADSASGAQPASPSPGEAVTAPSITGSSPGDSSLAPASSGPQQPVPGGTFTAQQFISILFAFPVADAPALPRAQAKQAELTATGIPAQILRTRDFPDLRPAGTSAPADAYLIYVGPFGSRDEATLYCDGKPGCLVARPNPNG